DHDVLAFDIAHFPQAPAKRRFAARDVVGREAGDEPDQGHRRLLRAPRKRPRRSCAAEQRDERAALHSITSSAATSSVCGTVRPSIRAVERLMTSSNFEDCTTGRSAGFVPLRTWPT